MARNTKRHRREPVRHPIPAPRLKAAPPSPGFDPDNPRLPAFEASGMAAALAKCPVDVVPLYAAMAVMHQTMSDAPINTCLPSCYQMAVALGHLGFDAEVMAAYVEVAQGDITHGSLGVRGPAILRDDFTTNGHVVLWVASFGRLLDPTIAQHPALLAAVHGGQDKHGAPLAVAIQGGRDALLRGAVGVIRPPFQINYLVQPQYTAGYDPWLAEFGGAVKRGGLGLAHATLDTIAAVGSIRNLRELPHLYPRLGALLAGAERLPALPEQPSES